jgi:hypothetical protein
MLTELAFLPSFFDSGCNPDAAKWKSLVDICNVFLGTPNIAVGVVVSDLHGGSWQQELPDCISRISDASCRRSCQDLLRACDKRLVTRPGYSDCVPADESEWAREALESHKRASIDRILMTEGAVHSHSSACSAVMAFNEMESKHFWNAAIGARSVPRDVQQQVHVLDRVLLHSQWIALKDPHALSNGDEFVAELFKRACSRPTEFGSLKMELHTTALDTGSEGQQNRVNYLGTKLRPWARAGDSVEVYFWNTHFVERHLIGGTFTSRSGCPRKKKRWCVSMTHTAWRGDAGGESATFALLNGEPPGAGVYERFVAEDALGKPTPYAVI